MESFTEVKIEIYIPESDVERLRDALHLTHAGRIGNYDHCLSITNVRGYWRPLEGASPFQGRINEIAEGTECKVEVRCERQYVSEALKVIRQLHPYDEPPHQCDPFSESSFLGGSCLYCRSRKIASILTDYGYESCVAREAASRSISARSNRPNLR